MGGKAEVGSTKWLSNNMKSKGLQRLRWYCQVCERQMRDENGFKQHCLSEAHNRNMQLVGENSKKFISNYSEDFKRDFLRLLRTAHGEKKVHANHFYQEYISDKQHIHMNATRWPSLTEFVKYLGREGICRVEEGERGLEIAWVDDSPEALRRREAVARKDRMERGDEEREAKLLEAQIKRAREQKEQQQGKEDAPAVTPGIVNKDPEVPIKLSLTSTVDAAVDAPKPVAFAMGSNTAKAKPTNVFSSKGNSSNSSSGGTKRPVPAASEPSKKVSELERIMLQDKQDQERKRQRTSDRDSTIPKRIRL